MANGIQVSFPVTVTITITIGDSKAEESEPKIHVLTNMNFGQYEAIHSRNKDKNALYPNIECVLL